MQIKYFQTAWDDIRNSPNWFGKLCLLALVGIIPVFGQIVQLGYLFGWAREIAWGVHEPLPGRIFGNEDGKLYRRGWFVLVITFVFALVPGIVASIGASMQEVGYGQAVYGQAPNGTVAVVGSLLYVIGLVGAAFASLLAWIGSMRSSIYDRLAPGFQFGTIWKMFRRDTGGILRIFGMDLLVGLVLGLVLAIVFSVLMLAVLFAGIGGLVSAGYSFNSLDFVSEAEAARIVFQFLASAGLVGLVALVVCVFCSSIASVFVSMLVYRAVGYWTSQFDVYRWKGQDDPLPFESDSEYVQLV